MATLGQKIKYFRKRSGFSQLQLEMEIHASPGTLSRIESGEVNPSKETLHKITKALLLSEREVDYLYGSFVYPSNDDEIENVITKISPYFNLKGVLAYMLDERWRVLYASKSLIKMLGYTEERFELVKGKTIIEFMFNDDLEISKFLKGDTFEKISYYQLSRYYQEVGFMQEDKSFKDSLNAICLSKLGKGIWDEVCKTGGLDYHNFETRVVTLNFKGKNISMSYSREPVPGYPRFEVIEYQPTNSLLKLLSQFI